MINIYVKAEDALPLQNKIKDLMALYHLNKSNLMKKLIVDEHERSCCALHNHYVELDKKINDALEAKMTEEPEK